MNAPEPKECECERCGGEIHSPYTEHDPEQCIVVLHHRLAQEREKSSHLEEVLLHVRAGVRSKRPDLVALRLFLERDVQ